MKTLAINLIVVIFLISCSAPLKYNKLSCDEIKQKQTAAEKEIKRLKGIPEYKAEAKAKIREAAILSPICIIMLPMCISGGLPSSDYDIYPLHTSVDKLKTDLNALKKASKNCPKEIDYKKSIQSGSTPSISL